MARTAAPLAPAAPQRARPGAAPVRGGALQAKLQVGASGDHFEREADRVAGQVMRAGAGPMAVPPTVTPLAGVQRKTLPHTPGREDEQRAGTATGRLQRKPAPPRQDDEQRAPSASRRRPAAAQGAQGRVQREAAAGAAGGTASGDVSQAIASLQSGSAPGLDGATRSFMESRFGRDLGQVRVHHGPQAADAAQALGAKAFTVGQDIFFNHGQYQPQSRNGRELLAHELTHTLQQTGGGQTVARRRIQRADDDPEPPAPAAPGTAPASTTFSVAGFPGASVDTTRAGAVHGTITLPTLALPQIANALKGTAGGLNTPMAAAGRAIPVPGQAFTLNPPAPSREDTVAAETWTTGARADLAAGVRTKLDTLKTAATDAASIQDNGEAVYYLCFKGGSAAQRDNLFIGGLQELAESDGLLRPQWTPNGRPLTSRDERLDADHFLEAQLGGADAAGNMWLLQASYNRSVGSTIANAIRNDVRRVVTNVQGVPEGQAPTLETVDAHWAIRFSNVARGTDFPRATTIFWTRDQIRAGEHLDQLKFMSDADLIAANIRLAPGQRPRQIDVYPGPGGGRRASFRLNGSQLTPPRYFFHGLIVNQATYLGDGGLGDPDAPLMSLNLTAFRTREGQAFLASRSTDVTVQRSPRLGIAGYLDPAAIRSGFSRSDFPGLSPLTFTDMGINAEGMLTGSGSIASTRALLPGLQVPLMLEGERLLMNFPLPVDALNFGPLSVTEAALSLGVGPSGLFMAGSAGLALQGVGHGFLMAELSEAGPRVAGQFDLALDFLDPAQVAVSYDLATDTLSAQATLGVGEGRLPGVESGSVTIGMSRDAVSVSGSLNLGGPLRGTVVNVSYTPTEGVRIGADNIPLPLANVPAVQNATLSLSAAKPPNADHWIFSGQGGADLAVPGATGRLDISYLDGAVTLHGQGTVARGPASGTLDFTATNRQIDATGQPIDGPLAEGINAWGRGSATVRFGKVLSGTAGIEYTPDNRIILSGTIAMPPVYEVFGRRDYTRDLFTLSPPEFPIWGVSLGGVGVGIFAFVDARVFFEAYVGPGQIRDAAVTATMDLDHPEDASVQGHGEFYVPAYAGLGLDVGGGLRARAAVAYAQGRVGLTGRLGVEAGAGAALDLSWSAAQGLALEADLHAEATPKFDLSATASVTVGVDLLVTDLEHTWGPWSRQLGSFGPDMTLGVRMPVRWTEAGGLDMGLDNIEITRPQLDAGALMTDVFEQLMG